MDRSLLTAVVLTGGKSLRFGRDKLREVLAAGAGRAGGDWLVDVPRMALAEGLGIAAACVGVCDAAVAARFDSVIEDHWPETGPMGGIASALMETGGDVFVLAGDLAKIDAGTVRLIAAAARDAPAAWAVLASARGSGGRIEPCIGIYRRPTLGMLKTRLGAGGPHSMHDVLARERVVAVEVDGAVLANVNEPGDLPIG